LTNTFVPTILTAHIPYFHEVTVYLLPYIFASNFLGKKSHHVLYNYALQILKISFLYILRMAMHDKNLDKVYENKAQLLKPKQTGTGSKQKAHCYYNFFHPQSTFIKNNNY